MQVHKASTSSWLGNLDELFSKLRNFVAGSNAFACDASEWKDCKLPRESITYFKEDDDDEDSPPPVFLRWQLQASESSAKLVLHSPC